MPLPDVPVNWTKEQAEEWSRKVAITVNQLLLGRSNNVVRFTLTPDATSTEVLLQGTTSETSFQLTPQSASAGTAVAAGLWVEKKIGVVIVHHDADPATDRDFSATFTG